MLCKRKCKYNISIVSSISVRSVNKIAFEEKKTNKQTKKNLAVRVPAQIGMTK